MRETMIVTLRNACIALILAGALGRETLAAHYKLIAGDGPGPTVVIVALPGTAGAAAEQAAWQLEGLRVARGRVVVGCAGPATPFCGNQREDAADDVHALVGEAAADWVVVLAEDFDFHGAIAESFGSTVTVLRGGSVAVEAAEEMCRVLQPTADHVTKQWCILNADQAGDRLNARAVPVAGEHVLLVTISTKNVRKEQHVALRTRQFRLAVRSLLERLEMISPDAPPAHHALLEQRRPPRVAIYDDKGAISSSGHDPLWIQQSLASAFETVVLVDAEDIRRGVLDCVDAVVFGGGSGTRQARSLDVSGRAAVRRFVERGGGYVGICAGAFLATSGNREYLGFVDCQPKSSSGSGIVDLAFTRAASDAIGIGDQRRIKFSGGPRIDPATLPETSSVWATFCDDLPRSNKEPLRLAGQAAVVAASFGKGRVVLFSPHPERWPGPREALRNALYWSATADLPPGSDNPRTQ